MGKSLKEPEPDNLKLLCRESSLAYLYFARRADIEVFPDIGGFSGYVRCRKLPRFGHLVS